MPDLPQSDFFDVRRDGAIFELRLNRPEKANAMDTSFWADLPRLMRAIDADETARAVVLSGEGKHFSSGIDLAIFNDINSMMSKEPGRAAYALRELILSLQDAFSALEAARVPVIAAVHGACIGGAVDLICACDIRLAAEDTRLSVEEINIGMAADVGTLQRLPKLIPMGLVMELAMTGRRFSAQEAGRWGLINGVYRDAGSVRAAALERAADLAAKSPLAMAGVKRAVLYARDHSVSDGLDQIATWNAGMLRPEDLMRAMQARMAKKQAEFADLLAAS